MMQTSCMSTRGVLKMMLQWLLIF